MKITFELDTCEFNDEFIAELFQKLRKPAPVKEAVPAVPQQTAAPKAEPQGGYYSVAATTGMEPVKTAPAQPKSSSMAWHWCENLECVEPIQIDHSIYLNTQCCPKCMTSTLHEAKTNTRKGAADERLAFLQKQRAETKPVAPAVPTAPTASVAEAPQAIPTAPTAPTASVAEAPQTVPTAPEKQYTREDIIAAASNLVISHPEKREELKGFIAAINIKSLRDLPDELIPETAGILREMGASL